MSSTDFFPDIEQTYIGKPQRGSMEDFESAKLAIMADVQKVARADSSGVNYSFISYGNLVKALRSSMVKHGMTVSPAACTVINQGEYTTSRGATMRTFCAKYVFVFRVGNTHEECEVVSEAADTSDKASSKAATQAMKYALRQFFMLEYHDDDPDAVRYEAASVRQQNLLRKMKETTDIDELNKLADLMEDPGVVTFTPSQREELRDKLKEQMDATIVVASAAGGTGKRKTPRKRGPKKNGAVQPDGNGQDGNGTVNN